MSAFRLIAAEKANHPVALLCEVLGVSRQGFYAWVKRVPSNRDLADAWLIEQIKEIHEANRGVYGSPRIHAELRMARGVRVGRKRVERLMAATGISGLVTQSADARPSVCPASGSPMTSWNGASDQKHRTSFGAPTSPICARGKGGCISRRCRTSTHGGSSAGRWPITSGPSWWSTRCAWPSPAENPRPG